MSKTITIKGVVYKDIPTDAGTHVCGGCDLHPKVRGREDCRAAHRDSGCGRFVWKADGYVQAETVKALSVYIIGSLRNDKVPEVGAALRKAGHNVFDDWYAAGPEADDYWQKYEKAKGHTYAQALAGAAAQNVYAFDKRHLDAAEVVVMVMPAGKSAHLELGYCAGKGKRTYILMDGEPDRFDVMYNFATKVVMSTEELMKELA